MAVYETIIFSLFIQSVLSGSLHRDRINNIDQPMVLSVLDEIPESFLKRNWLLELENKLIATRAGNTPNSLNDDLIEFKEDDKEDEECRERVEMIEETMYDEEVQCQEAIHEECFSGFKTSYKPTKVKECMDNFDKECHIEYKAVAIPQNVKVCNEIVERNCDIPGPEVCTDVPETVCETAFNEDTKADETFCSQVMKKICGPDSCSLSKKEVCKTKLKNIVQEIPEEKCELIATKNCKMVTKLVPNLKTNKNCLDVPKEVCATVKVNPRVVKTPRVQKICKKTTGPWNPYGEWSPCSTTCGTGSQYRKRNCSQVGNCSGFDSETRTCSTGVDCQIINTEVTTTVSATSTTEASTITSTTESLVSSTSASESSSSQTTTSEISTTSITSTTTQELDGTAASQGTTTSQTTTSTQSEESSTSSEINVSTTTAQNDDTSTSSSETTSPNNSETTTSSTTRIAPCPHRGLKFVIGDYAPILDEASSITECSTKCKTVDECQYWDFDTKNTVCRFFSGPSANVSHQDFIAAPKICP